MHLGVIRQSEGKLNDQTFNRHGYIEIYIEIINNDDKINNNPFYLYQGLKD